MVIFLTSGLEAANPLLMMTLKQPQMLEVLNSAHVKGEIAAAAQAVPGEIDGEEEDGEEHGRPPDPDPHEVPGEEIPSAGGRATTPILPEEVLAMIPLHAKMTR